MSSLESRKKWILPEEIPSQLAMLYETNGFSKEEAAILFNRGIKSQDEIELYFSDDLGKVLDISSLYNVEKASEEILKAVENGSKIFIHGDFDVDGVCATGILWEFIYRDLARYLSKKIDILPYIPDRVDEG